MEKNLSCIDTVGLFFNYFSPYLKVGLKLFKPSELAVFHKLCLPRIGGSRPLFPFVSICQTTPPPFFSQCKHLPNPPPLELSALSDGGKPGNWRINREYGCTGRLTVYLNVSHVYPLPPIVRHQHLPSNLRPHPLVADIIFERPLTL